MIKVMIQFVLSPALYYAVVTVFFIGGALAGGAVGLYTTGVEGAFRDDGLGADALRRLVCVLCLLIGACLGLIVGPPFAHRTVDRLLLSRRALGRDGDG